jgi:hypothetical protein
MKLVFTKAGKPKLTKPGHCGACGDVGATLAFLGCSWICDYCGNNTGEADLNAVKKFVDNGEKDRK